MIKVTLIALGRFKENYLRSACDEYQKRLSRYCSLNITELNPVTLLENPSKAQIDSALKKEAEQILSKIPDNTYKIALCVEGKKLSSESFAEKIETLKNDGKGICFIIGSSYGLDDSVKQKADLKLSLSDMTFPHQLFRVMLLEQIYRGFKINEGSTYHK